VNLSLELWWLLSFLFLALMAGLDKMQLEELAAAGASVTVPAVRAPVQYGARMRAVAKKGSKDGLGILKTALAEPAKACFGLRVT